MEPKGEVKIKGVNLGVLFIKMNVKSLYEECIEVNEAMGIDEITKGRCVEKGRAMDTLSRTKKNSHHANWPRQQNLGMVGIGRVK